MKIQHPPDGVEVRYVYVSGITGEVVGSFYGARSDAQAAWLGPCHGIQRVAIVPLDGRFKITKAPKRARRKKNGN